MNQQAQVLLTQAVEAYKTGHKVAAEKIVAAMKADPQLTYEEVAQFFGRGRTWARRLVKWYETGANGPIDWERGSHGTSEEAVIDKYLKTATAKEIKERLGPMRMVSLVAEAERAIIVNAIVRQPKLAEAIAEDIQANEAVNDARINRVGRNLGGGGVIVGSASHYVKPSDNRCLTFKMQSYSTKAYQLAQGISLTWKDDAPLADEDDLKFARNEVASMIIEWEKTLTKMIRDTDTVEVND